MSTKYGRWRRQTRRAPYGTDAHLIALLVLAVAAAGAYLLDWLLG